MAAQRARATRARALTPSRVFEVQRMQESFLRMQRALGSFERFGPRQLVRAWALPLSGDAAISFPRHALSFVVSYLSKILVVSGDLFYTPLTTVVKHDCSVSRAAAPRFARFVPRQLVRHLLEIDREAKLGVQVREIDSTEGRGVVAAQKDDT